MIRNFTTEELMDRWEDRREIKNVMARAISQDYLFRREKDVYEKYWSKAADVSLGVNEGYYSGAAAVKGYYEAIHRRTQLESALIQKKYPTRLGGKSEEEVYGVGVLRAKPLDTPVIEIAGDGQTAKGMWSIHGMDSNLTPAGQVAYWEWAKVAVDFVKEDGAWKIWHMLYLHDLYLPCGESWADAAEKKSYPDDPDYAELKGFVFPEPNVKKTLRETYHNTRRQPEGPDYPEPYETFSETFTYGVQ
jgi:hypothetical protein